MQLADQTHAVRRANRQVIGLDAIRCLAAVMVVTYHLGFWFWAGAEAHSGYGGFPVTYEWLAPATSFGWIGVQTFFVLSGFVIAYSAHGASALAFARGRVLRLAPAAWICATLTGAVLMLFKSGPYARHDAAYDWIKTVVFDPFGPWVDWAYWTLGIEIAFYTVIFGLLCTRQFHRMPLVVGAIGMVSTAYWIVRTWPGLAPGLAAIAGSTAGLAPRLQELCLLQHGCFFAIGAFMWLCSFKGASTGRVLLIALCVSGGVLQLRSVVSVQEGISHLGFGAAVPCMAWLVLLGLMVVSIAVNDAAHRRLGWLAAPMRLLGLLTYPLYLLHQVIGFTVLQGARGRVPDEVALGAAVALVVALSFVISSKIEPALRRVLKGTMALLASRRARATASR